MAIHLDSEERFLHRHLGPRETDVTAMLATLRVDSLDELIDQALPQSIRTREPLEVGDPVDEYALQQQLKTIAARNESYRSFIGLGYYDTITPPVIQRNILENPGWYTQYTPYQAEISQGRLEALLNFQTMVSDLTGLPLANASLLDEATAAAEAMTLLRRLHRNRNRFFVSEDCHPQTIAVLHTRAIPLGIDLVVGSHDSFHLDENAFGILLQYPTTDGQIVDHRSLCQTAHEAGASVVMAADLLSLVLLTPPGELGADIAVGNTQRFGVPLGYGGPHAAYFATQEAFKRQIPGRIIGLSKDRHGNPALRMALQTREQHIRRERATSNICTAQVLLAIMAGMYAVYHGPRGLKRIAERIHDRTKVLATLLQEPGHQLVHQNWFDTLRLRPNGRSSQEILQAAREKRINLRSYKDGTVGLSLDETTTLQDLETLASVFGADPTRLRPLAEQLDSGYHGPLQRQTPFLTHPVFNQYHSETELVRYLHRLESRDLSLTTSMIPLGSCTMKLNATTLMLPLSWEPFNGLHPFVPEDQARGYQQIFKDLETWLTDITGLAACSLQPNSGAQGEFTGLMVIQAYHRDHGQEQRRICLIPASAHGTNPASSVMAGMEVVIVECDEQGNIDLQDLAAKAAAHKEDLSALMVTYPSTHGVFEAQITTICELIHQHGGLVYLDGANLNALVGLSRLGEWGADVCHINLHKTFAIPHGGGGPGMGPICVTADLAPYLPTHPLAKCGGEKGIPPVSAAPWGSASILPISWAYIRLLGRTGLTQATRLAILNANYMAARLKEHFPILYRGQGGWVAHEFILDLRPLKKRTGITEEDVSKRLMDYGFHAPTTSFPVHGTLMIEPTESESKAELDRFCEALIAIKEEILDIERGVADPVDNVLKNAPHTAAEIAAPDWNHPYSREQAAYPAPWTKEHKFWPPVGRIDNAYGDRHLVCTCPPVSDYTIK